MVTFFPKHRFLMFLMIALSLGFASCSGTKSAVNRSWSLVKLVTVSDPVENLVTETVEVKNCGEAIEKTTLCSAGTSNDLNVSLTSGGAFGIGSQFIIEGNVGTTLGIGQGSGESVRLPTPPDGFIYTYTVNKSYQIITGQALARSSDGDEQTVNFDYHATCSIDVVNKEQASCSGNDSSPNNQAPLATTVSQQINFPNITVSANANNGVPFIAPTSGNYRFTIKDGIYCTPSICRSIIHGYLGRDVVWKDWNGLPHPIEQDYELGCWEDSTATNKNCAVDMSATIYMNAQQNIRWIVMEDKNAFADNTGAVILTVTMVP